MPAKGRAMKRILHSLTLVVVCTILAACTSAAPAAPTSAPAAPPTTAPAAVASPAAKPAGAPSASPSPGASPSASAVASPSPAGAAAASSPVASAPQKTEPSGPPLNPHVKVTVGDNQTLGVADVYIAVDRGYYTDEGIDIDLPQLGAPQVTIQALATSQINFAIANPDPSLFNAFDRNLDMKMMAALTRNKPGDHPASFMVRSELIDSGQYHSPKDLVGHPVGVPALQSQFYVNLVMQKDGLTAKDVDIKQFQQPGDLISAFASKSIDAGWTADPTVTQIVSQGLAKVVYVTGDLFTGAVGATLAMSPNYGTQQPDAAYRFVYATMRGHLDYYHAFIAKDVDKAPIVQILINHTPIKDPKLYDTIGLASVDLVPRMDTQSWEVLQSYFVSIGLQDRPADLASHVDNSYIEKAAAQMGLH
jgi:ABC-type nitrate/sulfonate/bicarbonate transport system substrate-binding protein